MNTWLTLWLHACVLMPREWMRRLTNAQLFCTVHKAGDLCRVYVKLHTSMLYARFRACRRGRKGVMSIIIYQSLSGAWTSDTATSTCTNLYVHEPAYNGAWVLIPHRVKLSQNFDNRIKKFTPPNLSPQVLFLALGVHLHPLHPWLRIMDRLILQLGL